MNTKVVIPKVDSNLYNYLKNSQTTKDYVANNYEKYQNGMILPGDKHITYSPAIFDGEKRALFGTIHNADMSQSKINNDGSFMAFPTDNFDFEKLEKRDVFKSKNPVRAGKNWLFNRFIPANNRAYKQQQAGQLENYVISAPITYTKNETDEIIKKKNKNQGLFN